MFQDLRILIANEDPGRLEAVARVVADAGHLVVEETVRVTDIVALTRSCEPDVAIVAVGRSEEHALDQIERIADESTCPVIVLLDASDPAFVAEAAERGAFASALDGSPEELQSSIDVALRRFLELRQLEAAHRRRILVERAKGILMERHQIDERQAFELLRGHARREQRKLLSLAEAVLSSHRVLARPRELSPGAVPESLQAEGTLADGPSPAG